MEYSLEELKKWLEGDIDTGRTAYGKQDFDQQTFGVLIVVD